MRTPAIKDANEAVTHPIALDRFDRFVVRGHGCWGWSGALGRKGYAVLNWGNGNRVSAHRFSYARYIGPIPEGLVVCHRCDNPPCANPDHLFAGTVGDNVRDCVSKGRHYFQTITLTTCPNGHPYEGGEAIRWNRRRCPKCVEAVNARVAARRRAASEERVPGLVGVTDARVRKGLGRKLAVAARTHCKRGHALTPENVAYPGTKYCNICRRLSKEQIRAWAIVTPPSEGL